MSTRPTTPRRARIRTIAPAAHAMVTAGPSGLWIVTGHGKRARGTQRNWVAVEGAFPTPFGRRTRRPHAPQAQSSVLSNRTSGVGSRRSVCDTDGRELTDERRYAPTSVPLRRNPCSRPPESLFHFTGIRSHPCRRLGSRRRRKRLPRRTRSSVSPQPPLPVRSLWDGADCQTVSRLVREPRRRPKRWCPARPGRFHRGSCPDRRPRRISARARRSCSSVSSVSSCTSSSTAASASAAAQSFST